MRACVRQHVRGSPGAPSSPASSAHSPSPRRGAASVSRTTPLAFPSCRPARRCRPRPSWWRSPDRWRSPSWRRPCRVPSQPRSRRSTAASTPSCAPRCCASRCRLPCWTPRASASPSTSTSASGSPSPIPSPTASALATLAAAEAASAARAHTFAGAEADLLATLASLHAQRHAAATLLSGRPPTVPTDPVAGAAVEALAASTSAAVYLFEVVSARSEGARAHPLRRDSRRAAAAACRPGGRRELAGWHDRPPAPLPRRDERGCRSPGSRGAPRPARGVRRAPRCPRGIRERGRPGGGDPVARDGRGAGRTAGGWSRAVPGARVSPVALPADWVARISAYPADGGPTGADVGGHGASTPRRGARPVGPGRRRCAAHRLDGRRRPGGAGRRAAGAEGHLAAPRASTRRWPCARGPGRRGAPGRGAAVRGTVCCSSGSTPTIRPQGGVGRRGRARWSAGCSRGSTWRRRRRSATARVPGTSTSDRMPGRAAVPRRVVSRTQGWRARGSPAGRRSGSRGAAAHRPALRERVAGPHGWTAIDPKPVAGHPGFDLFPLLHNRVDELGKGAAFRWSVRHRVILAAEASGDRPRRGVRLAPCCGPASRSGLGRARPAAPTTSACTSP